MEPELTTTFDAQWIEALRIALDASERRPRGAVTRDAGHMVLVVQMGDAELTIKRRKLLRVFGHVERLSYLYGIGVRPDVLTSYAPRYRTFTTDTGADLSAYGPRLAGQLTRAYRQLQDDPDTRQAVVGIWNGMDDCRGDKRDQPCTLSLQFRLSADHQSLDMFSTMRSNDLWWGAAYDVPAFAWLGLVMARWLGVEPGMLVHTAHSAHLYERHFKLAALVVDDADALASAGKAQHLACEAGVPRASWQYGHDETWRALEAFWTLEGAIRTSALVNLPLPTMEQLWGQWSRLAPGVVLEPCLCEPLRHVLEHWRDPAHVTAALEGRSPMSVWRAR
jgi:hypothetical protein